MCKMIKSVSFTLTLSSEWLWFASDCDETSADWKWTTKLCYIHPRKLDQFDSPPNYDLRVQVSRMASCSDRQPVLGLQKMWAEKLSKTRKCNSRALVGSPKVLPFFLETGYRYPRDIWKSYLKFWARVCSGCCQILEIKIRKVTINWGFLLFRKTKQLLPGNFGL